MMLNDRMVNSMKEQMVPSDDVIQSLLAKINEIDNSSASNVVLFEQPKVEEFKYKAKKPVYTYFASFAAAVLVLVSCFAVFGDGNDPAKVQEGIDKIIDNPVVVTKPIENENEDIDNPVIDSEKENEDEALAPEKDNNEKDAKNNKNEKNTLATNIGGTKSDSKTESKGESKPEVKTEVKSESLPDKWTKEILAEDEVSNVVVKGSNYVVGDTTKVMTTSKISTLSFDVEYEDEIYNVDATTKEIANVSPSFAVAMTSGDIGGTVVYLNKEYRPETLRDLVSDAGLMEKLSFSQARLFDNREGFTPTSSVSTSKAAAIFKDLILSNSNAKVVNGYKADLPYVFMVSNGSQNSAGVQMAFEVSANGLLRVKVNGDSTYVFAIGEELAERFIESF